MQTSADRDGPTVQAAATGRKAAQRKASTKALMNVALSKFISKGYNATSVEEIAAGAGLTKGAVYFYFKSKANLLHALLDEAERLIVDPSIVALRRGDGTPRDRLVAFLHSQSQAGLRNSEWMMLIILMSVELHGHDDPTEKRLLQISDRMKSTLFEIISAGLKDGTFTSARSAPELVTVIFGVNQGCFLEWYRFGDKLDGQALVRALRTTVLHGVLPHPE